MALTNVDYLAQVNLTTKSGIAKDNIINTYAAQWLDGGQPNFPAMTTAIKNLYDGLDSVCSQAILDGTTNAHSVKYYKLTDPEPRAPVAAGAFSWDGSTGTAFPNEVAVCASFSAEVASGVRAARRRGRVYLGAIKSAAGIADPVGMVRPTSTTMGTVNTAFAGFYDDLDLAGWSWCVWSRADDSLFPVVRGWCNDEFDTQRRRGPEPTTRLTWTRQS